MNRQLLRGVMVLGVILTLVGGTGIFAVFTDRATTATNNVSSGELPHAADLQIATASVGDQNLDGIPDVVCDGFGDDMMLPAGQTDWISVSNVQPGYLSDDANSPMICLHNNGSSTLELTVSAIDLTDADIGCTGDEAITGDMSCGLDATMLPQAGELSPLITVNVLGLDCNDATAFGINGQDYTAYLADLAVTPMAMNALQMPPGGTLCYQVRLAYPDTASATDTQLAQSDQVTWRFAFDGTVPSA